MSRPLLPTSLALALIAATGQVAADPSDFGRLFHTPAERARLDQPASTAPPSPPPRVDPSPVRLDGIVRRIDGKTVLWVDGQPMDPSDAVRSLDGRSALVALPDGRRQRLKVGDSAMPGSGE